MTRPALPYDYAWRGWIFENHTLKGPNIPFKKVVLPGRVKCGGTEVVAHGCRKRKKLICGPKGEIVVAHGRLPSPAHTITYYEYFLFKWSTVCKACIIIWYKAGRVICFSPLFHTPWMEHNLFQLRPF